MFKAIPKTIYGFNYRMTNLQAAIGVAQLERIEEIINFRKDLEENYKKHLADIPKISFQNNNLPGREKTTWLVCATINNGRRDEYMDQLNESGVDCRPFFYPLSSMELYSKYHTDCPISLKISKQGMNFPTSIPVEEDIMEIIKAVFNK